MVSPVIDLVQAIEKKRAKKAEEENIEGWLQVLHQGTGEEFTLKVMVDTGATVNAITYGMVIDYQLEGLKTQLKEPQVLGLAVGRFECKEQISISWMGKGNEEHDTSTFYVLPRGQANITDRVILSREWLNKRFLLYDKDPGHYLKPLLGGRQSVCMPFESQSIVGKDVAFANRSHSQESEKAARAQARQQAMNDQASSSKAKEAYQKSEGQKEQAGSSSGPKEARK